jgi:glycosyltransferase involved in cell wall biosynthesis
MRLSVIWRVLRAEGPAAVAARFGDRRAEARRRRSFRPAMAPPGGFSCAVLNLATAEPAPRLGGAQAQLLWRLEAEAELRPVALLYPEPAGAGGGYRLELQAGGDRRLLRLPAEGQAGAPLAAGPFRRSNRKAAATASVAPDPPSTNATGTAAGVDPPRGDARASRAAASGPPPVTGLADLGLERAVHWAASLCGPTALQIEGLAGMPLESLLRLHQSGLRLILAIHDFAAFCARPHLLEVPEPPAAPRFCHYSRDAARCASCLGRDVPGLPPGYQERRRELARQLLAAAGAAVYPSGFLARTYDDLFAGAGRAAARVIAPAPPPAQGRGAILARGPSVASVEGFFPHGPAESLPSRGPEAGPLPPAEPPPRAEPPRQAGPLPRAELPRHIAWVGAVQPHKGALVFEAAVRRLAASGRSPRLSAYGGGDAEILDRWRRLPGLRVRGYYRAGSLPRLLRRDGVDLALLLSVVPESYGLTLDECAAAGVPVVAFDLGAPAERIAAQGSGLLVAAPAADDPETAGAALAIRLADLLDGRVATPPPLPSSQAAPTATTARAWNDLYRQLGLFVPGA